VDAHGALIGAQVASLVAEHQAIIRDVLAAGDFWGGAGSVACQEFITQLGRDFQLNDGPVSAGISARLLKR
jgi:ESAT-6 family protein